MGFNPDSYLKKNAPALANGGFDPDAYLSRAQAPEHPKTSAGQTALESFGNSASLGYLPHLQAAVEPAFTAGMNALTGNNVQVDQSYVERRDENLRRQQAQAAENPKAAIAGSVGGLIVGGAAMSPLLPAAGGAGIASRIAQAAKGGAVVGGLSNPGDVEGEVDPFQLGDRGVNAGKGAAIGTLVQGGAETIAKASPIIADKLANSAAGRAWKALGGGKAENKKAMATGQDLTVGRQLLDEGAVPVLGSPGRIAKRVDALKEKAGEEIGSLIKSAGTGKTVDGAKLGVDLLESPAYLEAKGVPGMEAYASAVEAASEKLAQRGQMDLREALALKKGIDKSINFNKGPAETRGKQAALFDTRTAVRDRMNAVVNSVDEAAGLGAGNRLKAANRRYGNLETASDVLENKLSRDAANQSFGLGDKVAAGVGAASGGGPAAIALGAANKAARTFGNAASARAIDATSKVARRIGKLSGSVNPSQVAAISGALQRGDFQPEDPALIDYLRQNPKLIENVTDPTMRAKLERAIGRAPSAVERRLQKSR